MNNTTQVPAESFYHDRSEYAIIGLTGVAGSGCSSFSKLLESPGLLFKVSRLPKDFKAEKQKRIKDLDINASISGFVNSKKYEICYNFLKANPTPYRVIKYTNLLWLYLLLYIKHREEADLTGDKLANGIKTILEDKFRPSTKHDEKLKQAIGYSQDIRSKEICDIVGSFGEWDELAVKVNELSIDWVEKKFQPSESREDKKHLAIFFKDELFRKFVCYFIDGLSGTDYYSSCFFYHRLATQVRSIGDPFVAYDEWFDNGDKSCCDNLYVVMRLFVLLLDGTRETGENRRVVIDSIRNSAEAIYLKERYSGFYLVAIHDGNNLKHLRAKVEKLYKHHKYSKEIVNLFHKSLLSLDNAESGQEDFEKGEFASPDTNRVIERAELHIQNRWDETTPEEEPSMMYMAEQWIRYAALILHPGLVTPTTDERCMAVAYTAKLNSGCLSRQVGAAITNKDGSVRSIGWNEVPHGQVSCSLRTLDGIEQEGVCSKCSYSEFELMGSEKYKDGMSFIEKLKEDFGPDLQEVAKQLNGLPFSYCFKSLHNLYEGEKNQVFTRSLHAEENAIIQMSKYGGEALQDGVIYVTASPCELCSKKLYQIGVRKIVYIDPYPGIARQHILSAGFKQPELKVFEGAIGTTYFKLYQPFMPYKDEVSIRTGNKHSLHTSKELLKKILEELGEKEQLTYTEAEMNAIVEKVGKKFQRMKISVIIPSYKPGAYLWECLDSVYNQTLSGDQYEVVIILNGCNEPYKTQIEEYISNHTDKCVFRLTQTDTPGVSNARNIGIENSRGEFLTFVDDDDIISESYLEELLKVSDRSTVGCANSYAFQRDVSNIKNNFISDAYARVSGKSFNLFQFRQFLSPPWCKLIHRDIIGKQRFSTKLRLSEDSLFCLELTQSFKSMKLASPDAIYYQRERQGSAMRAKVCYRAEIKELCKIEIEYLKYWFSHPFSVNVKFMLSRIAAGFRNSYGRLKRK